MVNKTINIKADVESKPKFDTLSFYCRYITKNLSRDWNNGKVSPLYVFYKPMNSFFDPKRFQEIINFKITFMDSQKLQNFYKFFSNSTKMWKFLSPQKIARSIISFCPPNKFAKSFTRFCHRTKLTKILQVFVPNKFEKVLQVFALTA